MGVRILLKERQNVALLIGNVRLGKSDDLASNRSFQISLFWGRNAKCRSDDKHRRIR